MQVLFKIIERIFNKRIPMSVTIHFDGTGKYKLKAELGDKAICSLFTEVKEYD